MYANIFSFGERILPEYRNRDVMSLSRMKLKCAFNTFFPVNNWRDILNCSYKWFCFSNCYRCIGQKTRILFLFNEYFTRYLVLLIFILTNNTSNNNNNNNNINNNNYYCLLHSK